MLLVDDDQRERRQWREHGEARSHDEACFTCRGRPPVFEAFTIGEATVQQRDRHAGQRSTHPLLKLWREVYFRNQKKDLASGRNHARRGGKIDVRLTATGDPKQHLRGKRAAGSVTIGNRPQARECCLSSS